jgi:hypothetical protein
MLLRGTVSPGRPYFFPSQYNFCMSIVIAPDVKEILDLLCVSLKSVLEDKLFGIYLYGSLASGDFNPHTSDIDFLGVTHSKLTGEEIRALDAMHSQIASGRNKWAGKLEGSYLSLQALWQYDPTSSDQWPTLNEGRFFLAPHGPDWVIQRHILREDCTPLEGPPLQEWIAPVSPDDLVDAVRELLQSWWAPMLANPSYLERPEYQAYAVLTMCRALYTLENGEISSKPVSARWALSTIGDEWRSLIQDALVWKPGKPFSRQVEVAELIKEVCTR